MPVGVQNFKKERLAQVRAARGLTAVALSNLVDISASSISLYEKGSQKPQFSVVKKLAKYLNVPTHFFYNNIAIEKPEKIFYRSISSATKASRVRVEAQYEWALELIEYLQEFFSFPELNIPDIEVPDDFRELTSDRIEMIARDIRDAWRLGRGPIANVVRTLESNGIVIWRTAFEAEKLDAFSEYREPHPVIVLSSDKENYFRSRFDAAHELGHLILHRHIQKKSLKKTSDHKTLENQAHRFAGAFLLPATSFHEDIGQNSISVDLFRGLKPKWNVSIAMQIQRASDLGLVDDHQKQRLWINLSRRKWRRQEPLDEFAESEKPNLISKSVRMLFEARVRSKEQIAHDLSLSHGDIERLSEIPLGFIGSTPDIDEPSFRGVGGGDSKVLPFKR